VQPFGDAVSAVASNSYAQGLSDTEGEVGGTSTTSGEMGSLSGIDGTLPVGVNAPVYDVPAEVLAQAMTESANNSDLQVGETEPQVNLPVEGGMSSTELPSFASQRSMPADDFSGALTGVLSGFAGGMSGLPGQGQVADVADMAANGGVQQTPQILPAPARSDMQPFAGQLGDLPTGDLPTGDSTGQLPVAVPAALPVQRDLPSDLTDVTTLIPAVPAAGNVTDVTTVMPAVPAAPGLDGIADAPLVQAPSVGTLPVPGVSQVAAPELGGSSLDSTRAALANLFTTHPIA